jgi:hypothetical protein
MPKLGIRVGKRFQRSVNLEADYQASNAVRGYVVSPLAWDTLCRVAQGVASPTGNRAWSIIGPYGSGKSSFAAFLANLLAPSTRRGALRRLRESWGEDTKALSKTLRTHGKGLLAVPVVGERAPLALILARGLERALSGHWTASGRRPQILASVREAVSRLEAGRSLADSEVVALVLEAAAAIQKSKIEGEGLCIILDEFGKSLEWAALHPQETDLYLLQLLAEAANRDEEASFVLLTIQHQGLEAYADRLSIQQRREWEKVAGRFEAVPYLESPRYLARLVAEAIEPSGDLTSLLAWPRAQKARKTLQRAASGELPLEDLERCFPLSPAAALLLGPLFRLDLGQNERSLFSFLSSREPCGFQDFLSEWNRCPEEGKTFELDEVYDYILANTRVLLSTGAGSRVWRTAEEAIRRLPKEAGPLEERLIKVVALLTLTGSAVGLSATAEVLGACLSATPRATKQAIATLEDASVLLFRQYKGAYQLWDGSDLDVGALLKAGRDRVVERGGIAAQVQEVITLPPFLAARHYLQTGTLRTFECQFLSAHDHHSLSSYSGDADGLIAIVLPEQRGTYPDALPGVPVGGKPVLSLHLKEDSPLLAAALDSLGARDALRATPELENDPIARRALEELRLAAWDRLQEQLAVAFHGVAAGSWHANGQPIAGARNLSELATSALEEAYSETPPIHNELLNRSTLSSAAAAARRELLERLLAAADQPRLGIEGNPPELSMYLSVIEENRLHQPAGQDSTRMGLCAPPQNSSLHPFWGQLDQFFQKANGEKVSLTDIYARFSEPPYGIREGLLPVLLFCYLLVHQRTAFLYEDGTFIPALEKDHVQRFLSRPQTFEVQKLALDKKARQALRSTASALGMESNDPDVLEVVRSLYQSVARMSSYARQTQRLSQEARNLRACIFSARDPLRLLHKDLPRALGCPSAGHKDFAQQLRSTLLELDQLDAKLVSEITQLAQQAFGRGALDHQDWLALRDRAERIDLEAFQVQPLARVVLVLTSLDGEPGDDWFRQFALALVGKPVLQWRDQDLPIFRSVLFEAARQFAAAEAGSSDLAQSQVSGDRPQLASIAWLSSGGGYDTAVAALTPERLRLRDAALPDLERMAQSHGMGLREFLALALVGDTEAQPPANPEEAFALEV